MKLIPQKFNSNVSRAAVLICITWFFSLGCLSARAEEAKDCVSIDVDADRLRCYDRILGRSPQKDAAQKSDTTPNEVIAKPVVEDEKGLSLANIWELDATHKRGTFRLLPHNANYLLPIRYSDRPNPTSHSPSNTVSNLDRTEAKFQVSVRVKALENILGDNGDLWVAYTQQSNWQSYNTALSSPFRETDHSPEVMFVWGTDTDVFGWKWRMVNFGLVHQSNGLSEPLSRSWNRIYAQFGFERGKFILLARPWMRLGGEPGRDDNPDIRNYMGSGDVRLAYHIDGHVISALGRYSVGGRRGALQLDWTFPLAGALRGYVQLFSGYGESLIDYNHRQNTLGVGVLLVPWR